VGHLWGTRLAAFTSGGIQAKDGALSAGFESNLGFPGSGSVTAMSVDGSRVAIVRGGNAYIKDGSLNQSQPNASWHLLRSDALDVKIAGGRIAVLLSDRRLVVKEGAIQAQWSGWPNETVADSVWKIALTPTRIGVLRLNGSLIVKEGAINSGWYTMLGNGQAKDIVLTDTWVGTIGNVSPNYDHFRAVNLPSLQTNPSFATIDSPVTFITMGGNHQNKRIAWVRNGEGRAKQGALNGQIIPIGAAVEMAVNSGRIARRLSSGQIYACQGETVTCPMEIIASGSGVRLN
jgi:hypothetical protein